MSFNVELSANFQKEAKRLVKKYASLRNELAGLFTQLETNPTLGTPMGDNVYKIRLAIAPKGKGKSGGARVMTYVKVKGTRVLVFSIYDKAEKDSISEMEIRSLLKQYK